MDIIDFKINPSLILIDGQEPRLSNAALNKFPNAISVIDAGRDTKEVRELCKKVDYVACSKNFAESVTGVRGCCMEGMSLWFEFFRWNDFQSLC